LKIAQSTRTKKIVITHPCVKSLTPTSLQATVDGFTNTGSGIVNEDGAIFQRQGASNLRADGSDNDKGQANVLALDCYCLESFRQRIDAVAKCRQDDKNLCTGHKTPFITTREPPTGAGDKSLDSVAGRRLFISGPDKIKFTYSNESRAYVSELPQQEIAPIARSARVFVAGHRGLVGSAVWRHLSEQGFTNLIGVSSRELDLRNRDAVFDFFDSTRPEVVVDAAARVGGIHANNTYPAEFLSDNLLMQVNLMDAANHNDVDRLIFLGSSCIYPKFADQPIREDSLLTGALEETNDAYAIAKITGIMQVQASRRQYGRRWISAMPTNLYGPGDNFHPDNSHVMPALMRRLHAAKQENAAEVVIWGTGTPRREFLHVDDLAAAVLFLLENYDSPLTINVGVGEDVSIRELAELVAQTVGYQGKLVQDTSKPDGTPRKLLDVSRINNLGWKAKIPLEHGLQETYQWFLNNLSELRDK
jgi:GDP-L-fucose synthase